MTDATTDGFIMELETALARRDSAVAKITAALAHMDRERAIATLSMWITIDTLEAAARGIAGEYDK